MNIFLEPSVDMFEMLIRNIENDRIQFFIGDVVQYTNKEFNIVCIGKIKYPICYTTKNECVYILEDYNTPLTESELILISSEVMGIELTLRYCEKMIKQNLLHYK